MYQSMAAGTRLRLWMAVLSFSAVFIVTGCFDVKINGQTYPKETEYFTVTDKNIEDYSVFNKFTDLKTLDLLSVDISASEYDSIASKVNDGTFILWNVPFGNTKVSNISHTLDISPELQLTDTQPGKYFFHSGFQTIDGYLQRGERGESRRYHKLQHERLRCGCRQRDFIS